MMTQDFLTVTQAADRIGITTGRLRQMLRANEIEGVKMGPRMWLLAVDEVDKLKQPQRRGRPRGNNGPYMENRDVNTEQKIG
jgi:excisionase family DNA binding protein|tara:strand:+ start:1033 stop:1278 length:246 start_codon:yes stop_codon:yes gene_type:complete